MEKNKLIADISRLEPLFGFKKGWSAYIGENIYWSFPKLFEASEEELKAFLESCNSKIKIKRSFCEFFFGKRRQQAMKMIKISNDHYILVGDNSEINYGTFFFDFRTKLVGQYFLGDVKSDYKKITHSTEPLEPSIKSNKYDAKDYVLIKPLSLSEVEEAIYGYNVEKMADEATNEVREENADYIFKDTYKEFYKEGFNAHKELVKNKYNSVLPMLLDVRNILKQCESTSIVQTQINIKLIQLEKLIQPLLPKTEWDVEFDEQGKLKLL